MRILLVNNGTRHLRRLESCIRSEFPKAEIMVREWNDLARISPAPNLVILSGSSKFALQYHKKEFAREMALVKKSHVPVLGICFGCELIAKTFGGTLRLLPKREKGILSVEVKKWRPFFGKTRKFKVYEGHRWMIDKLPKKFHE